MTTRARILIVDDVQANLEVLGSILAPDYDISVALNGPDALNIANSDHPPDLILLDIMMPGMNGYEVCSILKGDEKTRHIPVIFATAMIKDEDEAKGFEVGAVDYITKPISPPTALARVTTHLAMNSKARLLEEEVRKRTSELERAKDEAEAANHAKSAFLANMSHELRTPLNAIMGVTQLLLVNNPSEEQEAFLKDELAAAEHLMNIVNDLLELSNAETRQINLCHDEFTIDQIIQPLLNIYEPKAREMGLNFICMVDETVPEKLYGDPKRIRQVLINLLNNSLRYTEQGSILLDVCAWHKSVDNGEKKSRAIIEFKVQDTGVGIETEKLEHIFEPFAIAENFMVKERSGAGLGLSISRRLVEAMGGKIWMESKKDRGTTAFFTIPCGN